MNNRPKRRRSKDNPYFLNFAEEKNTYLVSFRAKNNQNTTMEISKEIYDIFDRFELDDLSILNEYDNHIEHLDLGDESLFLRAKYKQPSIENIVEQKLLYEKLYKGIFELPIIQRRRLIKYYFYNMTFESIAKEEKCSKRAIKFSVDIAIKKLYEKLKDWTTQNRL